MTPGASRGLADRRRRPHHSPCKLSDDIVALILARHRWNWGPRKLRVKLAAAHSHIVWPAESTIGEVLKRGGLTHRRKPRVRTPPYAQPFASIDAANQTWCADFKGWSRTGDGTRCNPITISDSHSRYLLRCHIVPKADTIRVAAIFDATFREHGLRLVIHTENGAPLRQPRAGRAQPRFDAMGQARRPVSAAAILPEDRGIVPERSRPASPQDNGMSACTRR